MNAPAWSEEAQFSGITEAMHSSLHMRSHTRVWKGHQHHEGLPSKNKWPHYNKPYLKGILHPYQIQEPEFVMFWVSTVSIPKTLEMQQNTFQQQVNDSAHWKRKCCMTRNKHRQFFCVIFTYLCTAKKFVLEYFYLVLQLNKKNDILKHHKKAISAILKQFYFFPNSVLFIPDSMFSVLIFLILFQWFNYISIIKKLIKWIHKTLTI